VGSCVNNATTDVVEAARGEKGTSRENRPAKPSDGFWKNLILVDAFTEPFRSSQE
jgi:hypothetical protein